MESLAQGGQCYSRFERHARLHQLYREVGDLANAKGHLEACLRLSPEDPELSQAWRSLYLLPLGER